MKTLYVVYLGGEPQSGRMGEDHEVVFVVADDLAAARRAARTKWRGAGRAHIDAVAAVEAVDGHRVTLVPDGGAQEENVRIDPTYVP